MGILDFGTPLVLPRTGYYVQSAVGSQTLGSTTDAIGTVFNVPKSGDIDRITLRTNVVTTGCTVRCALETVGTGVIGEPAVGGGTPTLIATDAYADVVIANTDDDIWVNFDLVTPPTVAAGDRMWVTLRYQSGAGCNMSWIRGGTQLDEVGNCWSARSNAGAAWTTRSTPLTFGVRYDGETPYTPLGNGIQAFRSVTNNTYSDSSTPDERGNKFLLPWACRIVGIRQYTSSNNVDHTMTVKLYDSTGVTLHASGSHEHRSSTANTQKEWWFDTPYDADAGEEVLASIRATNTASAATYQSSTDPVGGNFSNGACPYVTGMMTRSNDGAWTTVTNEAMVMSLLVDRLYVPDRVTGSA